MATTATIDGKDLPLKVGSTSSTTKITNLIGNSANFTTGKRKTTSKDSGTYEEYKMTRNDLTFPFRGWYTKTVSTSGFEDLLTWKDAGTEIYWEMGSGTPTEPKWTGRGFVEELTIDSEDSETVEFSGTIQNTGDPTYGVYP